MSRLPANGILPPPPWRLRDEFVREQRMRALWALFGALLAGLYLYWWGIVRLLDVRRDHAIHDAQHVTADAQWYGVQRHGIGRATPLMGTTTIGDVSFQLESGRPCFRRLDLWTTGDFDTTAPLVVYHDPSDPSRWTTNWSIEQTGSRLVQAGLAAAIFAGITAWLVLRSLRAIRLLRIARRVTSNGVAALGVVESHRVVENERRSSTVYRVVVENDDGRTWRVSASYPKGAGRPLTLPGRRVLLLVGEGDAREGLVLRQDLWPLRLSDEAVQHACDVLRQIDPDAGWRTSSTVKGLRLSTGRGRA